MRHHLRIDPGRVDVLRVDGEPRRELEPGRPRRRLEPLELGPRRLRVDVVDRHRRDAAPVVDAGVEQPREVVVGEVRRRLDAHLRAEDEPRGRRRPQELVERRLRRVDHLRPGLRAEVLDDHLLDVPVALVEVADREQRVDPLLPRLADADEDPRREGDAQLAGQPDRLQPHGRALVGRAEVRPSALGQPVGRGLEHDPLRGGDLAQRRQLVARHHARVRVRQQAGLLEHEPAHAHEVLDRRLAAELGELLAGGPVAALRLVAEREQRLAATCSGAGARDVQHLVRGHVRALALPRRRGERAVVADVPAELRQRDEDLRRERDEAPLALLPEPLRGAGDPPPAAPPSAQVRLGTRCENTQRGYARAHPREAAGRREVAARGGARRRRAGGSRARAARARARGRQGGGRGTGHRRVGRAARAERCSPLRRPRPALERGAVCGDDRGRAASPSWRSSPPTSRG